MRGWMGGDVGSEKGAKRHGIRRGRYLAAVRFMRTRRIVEMDKDVSAWMNLACVNRLTSTAIRMRGSGD